MAVCWATSFDHLATADLGALGTNAGGEIASSGGVVGSFLRLTYYDTFYKTFAASAKTSVWGHFRFRTSHLGGGSANLGMNLALGNGTKAGIGLYLNSSGYWEAHRLSTLVNWPACYGSFGGAKLGTGTVQLAINTWYSIQFEITIDNAAGIVNTWVNGQADLALTGQDTDNGSISGALSHLLFGNDAMANADYDDVIVGDTSGSVNTAHSGDVRVDAMRPNANGDDSGWTRSAGSDDYALVDDTTPNTSDYLESAGIGSKTCVNLQSLTNVGGEIKAVVISGYLTKTEAGDAGCKFYLRTPTGGPYYSDEQFPSYGSWAYFSYVWDVNPETSAAWTETAFNSLQGGVEQTS